jgi:hypothetical protein
MLVHAFHTALEDRVIALDRVRGDVAPNVFFGLVIDRFVPRKIAL